MTSKFNYFIRNYWILIVFALLKLFLQYALVNPVYTLHRDEFLYLDQANHLAFGYISVPPLTAVFSKIIFLFGGSIFLVRFVPALFGTLTVVVAWLIVEEIGGRLAAKILVVSALVFSVLIRLNILFQPNSFDVLAWTTVFYLLIRYLRTEKTSLLYYLAIVIALGLYNKYNLAFLLIGLLITLFLVPQRKLFFNFSFLKAIFVTIVLISPNIIWQIVNHFPVIHHMEVLRRSQLDNNSAAGFLISQVRFFAGSLPLLLGAFASFIFCKSFKPYRFVGICYVIVLALYVYLKAKDYYALGLYPVLIAFGAVYTEKIVSHRWLPIVASLLVLINLGIFIAVARLVEPVMSPAQIAKHGVMFKKLGLLRWEDGKDHTLPQDFADMIGWREMAAKALQAYHCIPADERRNTLIFCDNYGQVGALNYFDRGKMPEAYSFNTDYIDWLPHLKHIQNVVLVGSKPAKNILAMFKKCVLKGIVENKFAREKGTQIYLLTGASDTLTTTFYKMAEERKKNFDIF